MTFDEFCKYRGLTKEEKRAAFMFLLSMRLMAMWEMWDDADNTDNAGQSEY